MHGLTWLGAASAPSISFQLAPKMPHPLRTSFRAWWRDPIAVFLCAKAILALIHLRLNGLPLVSANLFILSRTDVFSSAEPPVSSNA